jgi:hypothetical protein
MHEVTAAFNSRSRSDFQAWLVDRSVEVVGAARLMYDDTRRPSPPGDDTLVVDMLTVHRMLTYTQNLEMLDATLTGLAV